MVSISLGGDHLYQLLFARLLYLLIKPLKKKKKKKQPNGRDRLCSLHLPPPPAGLHCTHCTCAYYVSNDRGTADILAACREAQPPLMTQLIVLRASAPHPPTHVPTPNTHTHTHTGSNEEPPTQLQTPVCLCWKRGGGYTHSHSRGRNIAIMCAHTHTYTQLWLSYCGRGGLMIADKHTVHTCSDARFAHDFLILSSHSPEH